MAYSFEMVKSDFQMESLQSRSMGSITFILKSSSKLMKKESIRISAIMSITSVNIRKIKTVQSISFYGVSQRSRNMCPMGKAFTQQTLPVFSG